MAFSQVITTLLFALAIARISPSACQTVEGKVSCTDCADNYDFSGIKVSVKCEGVKNLAMATTEDKGFSQVDLPSDQTKPPSVNCFTKLLGGPNTNLYASKKNLVSQIVKGKEKNTYTISTPLSFFTSCPQNTECKAANYNQFGSSKTFDLPLPREWGLAPSSFYVPFFPIIGIP
uniref:Pollen Ole e 1 allergen and extensin family protein n=1 Tax=Glycine max TaxID=3847 RepID=C6SZD3_SOYBN|nr:unknown [Glycine max]